MALQGLPRTVRLFQVSLIMSVAPRFHRLGVSDLRREAADAVSMTFAIPKELEGDYSFTPGQYLTLRTTMDGEAAATPRHHRNSYRNVGWNVPSTIGSPL